MGLPFKPADWVADGDKIAKVLRVYEDCGDVLFDLVMYARDGEKLGRTSPAMGGPRTFEPACNSKGWRRIAKPVFPLQLKWVPGSRGRKQLQYWAGPSLPPADWTPKPSRRKQAVQVAGALIEAVEALKKIAAGHNDARGLACDVLGIERPRE